MSRKTIFHVAFLATNPRRTTLSFLRATLVAILSKPSTRNLVLARPWQWYNTCTMIRFPL